MKPSPKDLEPVQIQVPKEIAINQLMVAKSFIHSVFNQMQSAQHSFALVRLEILDSIDHAIDVISDRYKPEEPDPEEVAKLNRNVAKIQQWAKG